MQPSRPYPRPCTYYSILPEAKQNLAIKAREMGLSASRLLELILLGKIASPFGGSEIVDNEGSTGQNRE